MSKKEVKDKKKEVMPPVTTVEEPITTSAKGIIVKDPQILRPKELPLVITPEKGKWANEEQAEFAATLNAYAYKNPEKWAVKKDDRKVNGVVVLGLISKLSEIGNDHSAIIKHRGHRGKVGFNNKLLDNNE